MTVGSVTSSGYALARRRAGAVSTILNIGVVAAVLAVPLSFAARATALTPQAPHWLLPIALVALAVGVPHGAVDHLTFRSALTARQFAVLVLIYTFIAGLGAAAIIAAPVPSFLVVLAATVWHFGTGDAEAASALHGTAPDSGLARVVLALPRSPRPGHGCGSDWQSCGD
jgi:hypothetical protein